MAAITDLTAAQLNQALKELIDVPPVAQFVTYDQDLGIVLCLDILTRKVGIGDTVEEKLQNYDGMIKALALVLEGGRKAQEKINVGKPVAEQLKAFPPATTSAITNGFALMTRQLVSRHDLGSATRIIG